MTGLSKKQPGDKKSAPQSQSIKMISRSKDRPTKIASGAKKSAPQGQSIKLGPRSQENNHHRTGLSKKQPQEKKSAPQSRSIKIISRSNDRSTKITP